VAKAVPDLAIVGQVATTYS